MKLKNIISWSVFGACSVANVLAFVLAITVLKAELIVSIICFVVSIIISALVSVLVAKAVTKKVVNPINNIDLSLEKEVDLFEELQPFSNNLKAQTEMLDKQMKKIKREHKMQDKIRKEFTANVSHELKTPLTSISGYAEIMKNGMVKPEDVTRFSEKIYNEAGRLIVLVGDIIKLSHLDENIIKEKKERIELYSLCQTIISRLESSAQKQKVSFSLQGGTAEIVGIPRIIEEIIYNLCDNAIKYNRENGQVTVAIKQTSTNVILSVSDTGIGVEKEDLSRIFERFYRVNKSRSKDSGGTGLGLSIVKHGARVHNAKLTVDSKIGEGTTFTIKFAE